MFVVLVRRVLFVCLFACLFCVCRACFFVLVVWGENVESGKMWFGFYTNWKVAAMSIIIFIVRTRLVFFYMTMVYAVCYYMYPNGIQYDVDQLGWLDLGLIMYSHSALQTRVVVEYLE